MRLRGRSPDDHIRRDIAGYNAAHGREAVFADLAELVDQGKAAQDGVIVDVHVPRQGRGVGHDAAIAHHAVVRNVGVGHQQIVVADGRDALVLNRAAMDGDEFADDVTVADLQSGRLTGVLLVLAILAHRRKLINSIVPADAGRPLEHHMRTDDGTGTYLHARSDNGKRPDADVVGQYRIGIDEGAGMNQASGSAAAHIISALATKSPSTSALQEKLQIFRLWRTYSVIRVS